MAKVNPNQRAIRLSWGIPLTAVLIGAFSLVFVYIYIQNSNHLPGYVQVWLPCLYSLGTALGGAIGVRIALLNWRQVILSALLAGVGLLVLKRSIIAVLLWSGDYFGIAIFQKAPFFLMMVAAGSFLLPLFDPAVRRLGPAPSLWKVMLVVSLLCLFMAVSGIMVRNAFAVVFIGIVPASLGILVGLMLTLANLTNAGSWLGGLAVLVPLFILAFSLLGYPF